MHLHAHRHTNTVGTGQRQLHRTATCRGSRPVRPLAIAQSLWSQPLARSGSGFAPTLGFREVGNWEVRVGMGLALEFCDSFYASDLTDTEVEVEVEVEDYEFTPRAFERRGSKRTHGVVVDSGVMPERRKRSRIDEQIELLRAAIPNLRTNEKASILAGAFDYIEKLQRQVLVLHDELEGCSDDDEEEEEEGYVSSCEDEEERPVEAECCACSPSTVEVVRTDEGLKVHVQCEKRPRVLAEIMELLESSGMSVEQVSISYQENSQFVFDCLGSEVDGIAAADRQEVETCLKSLIADQGK